MLRVTCPPTRPAARRYIIETILGRWLGHDYTVVESEPEAPVTIELAGADGRLILADHILSLDRLDRLTELESGPDAWVDPGLGAAPGEEQLPVLWGPTPAVAVGPPTSDAMTVTSLAVNILTVNIDVLGSAFALITGLSELSIGERDAHGRIPMAATIIGRRNLVGRPVVDEYVAVLASAMTRLWPNVAHHARSPSSVPTHDVDRLRRYGTTAAGAPLAVLGRLRTGDVAGTLTAAREAFGVHVRGRDDPHFSFDRIMDASDQLGVVSNFYFIPRYRRNDGTPPSRYSMDDPMVGELLTRIDRRGHNIGIHPGYDSFRDAAALLADVAALQAAAARAGVTLEDVGGRHHYLRWDPEHSPGCWDDAGLAHDSSFGFAEQPGFRAGTSRPFLLWDHVRERATGVEERPLIWMDASIFATDPDGLESEAVLSQAVALREHCYRHGGDFTFLVHNDGYTAPGGPAAYRLLLTGR